MTVLCTKVIRFTVGSCTHCSESEPVKAAVLNCDTEMVPVLLTIQVPMLIEYITVLTPLLAMAGLNKPPGVTALLPTPVQVPVAGLAVKVTGEKISQSGAGIVSEGVKGLLMVMPMVLVTGQKSCEEEIVTLYGMVASVTLVGKSGG